MDCLRTSRQLHALVTLVGLFWQFAAHVGIVAVASAVYVEQKGMADGALFLMARRQLSAEQARLLSVACSGASVGCGIARVGWRVTASRVTAKKTRT